MMHAANWIRESGRFLRSISAGQLRKVLNRPKHTCTWCGGHARKPRRTWCSEACFQAYTAILPSTCASLAYSRDRGICQLCGVDTIRITSLFLKFRQRWMTATTPDETQEWKAVFETFAAHVVDLGFRLKRDHIRNMTEGDHIIPVVRGGGLTGVENYRTVCVPCHTAETRKLNKTLMHERRKQQKRAG